MWQGRPESLGDFSTQLSRIPAVLTQIIDQAIEIAAQKDDIFIRGSSIQDQFPSVNKGTHGKNHCGHIDRIFLSSI